MPKIKYSFLGATVFALIFFTLFIIRLEIFPGRQAQLPVVPLAAAQRPAESWLSIHQNNKKIGVVHRTFNVLEKGYRLGENVFMQINTMGITQTLTIAAEGDLNPDMTFSSFSFELNSSLFRFHARGYVMQNKLILYTGVPGAQQKSEIVLREIPHLSSGIYEAAFRAALEKDMIRSFSIFDPSTLSLRSIQVTRNPDEIISVMGKRILTRKYCADFMGAKNCAWLDNNGDVLRETGILGLTMEKVSPEKAREGIAQDDGIDFTQIASLPANVVIENAERLNLLKIKISGISRRLLHLNGDRQNYRQEILTITREETSNLQFPLPDFPQHIAIFLQATPLVQAHHPLMKEQVDKIIKSTDSAEQKLRKIITWVYRNIDKKPVLSVPNALEVLKNKTGDCNEHAVLVAALLRTAGIPAQIETGLVYLRGRFYYHAWNVAFLGNWITADAVFNQFPADLTHIRLIRGESSEQLDLLGVMGKIKLEILEQRK